ncbi:hypothetical protein SDC9_61721 [bioreactor metagenome]|uniref:Antitoxin SocA-like Panacea domain-containing protein n=1 Tax=bioreactor metagenome TaxID=1076179 RepID=A0A644XGJ7_9ZZZZ
MNCLKNIYICYDYNVANIANVLNNNINAFNMHKNDAFKAFLREIAIRRYSDCKFPIENDFGKVKVFKLLFFTVAATSSPNEMGLLDVFDKFYAMPYGPVESDIMNALDNELVNEIQFSRDSITCDLSDANEFDSISKAVGDLLVINPGLLHYKPFDLVEISHKWNCWKQNYYEAVKNGISSKFIPRELIMSDIKFFY